MSEIHKDGGVLFVSLQYAATSSPILSLSESVSDISVSASEESEKSLSAICPLSFRFLLNVLLLSVR